MPISSKTLLGESLPVNGRGEQVRDWLHVEDHVCVLKHGVPGRRYAAAGDAERRNIDVVAMLCVVLDRLHPRPDGGPHAAGISYVTDSPGHDQHYAIDASRIRDELGWAPRESFESGREATVRWYLDNRNWWRAQAASGTAARRGLGGDHGPVPTRAPQATLA